MFLKRITCEFDYFYPIMQFSKAIEILGHAGAVYACTASGDYLYSASADKHVVRWFLTDGKQDKFAIKFNHSVYSLESMASRYLFAGLSSGDFHIFDLQKNEEVKFYKQHKKAIFSIRYNEVKKQLYVGDADGNLSVWDSETLELIIYLPLDCGKIRSIAISNDGCNFALACQDGEIRVFESEFFNEINSFYAHENGATAVLFHPVKKDLLISGGKDALLKVWNWKKENELQKIIAHTFAIYDLIAVEQGRTIISASRDKHVKIWKLEDQLLQISQRLDAKQGGHKHSVNALAKISENKFASCSDDKKIIVWELS
ncbi:MAG: hypothetical protein COA33_009575 [Fluviicola sp.]|nr:hypothetical protein [Fluviicola sp.]